MFMMWLYSGQTNKYGRQKHKYIGLNIGDQYFHQINKNGKKYRHDRHTSIHCRTQLYGYENQTGKTQYH